MKRVFKLSAGLSLLALCLLGFTGPAVAQNAGTVDLSWVACLGLAGAVQNMDYASPGDYDLVASGIGFNVVTGEKIFGHRVDINIGGATGVPDAWRFDDTGDGNPDGCAMTNGLTFEFSSSSLTGCTALKSGSEVPIVAYWYQPDAGTHGGIAWLTASTAYPAGRTPVPATRYNLWRFRFGLDNSICTGADQKMCFAITRGQTFPGIDPNNTIDFGLTIGQQYVTFNDATNTLGCPGLVPSQPSTWGKVKGLYR